MNSVLRRLSLLTLVLFILGIFVTTYVLYNLPYELTNTAAINSGDVEVISPVLVSLNTVIGLTLLAGVASVIFSILFEKGNTRENVVYVQAGGTKQSKEDALEKNIGIEQEEEEALDISSFDKLMKGSASEQKKLEKILSKLCSEMGASQGAYYVAETDKKVRKIRLQAAYAFSVPESEEVMYEFGEGLAGQVAKEQKPVNVDSVPEGYIKVISGLGESSPTHLFISPVFSGDKLEGVVEISSFEKISKRDEELINEVFTKFFGQNVKTTPKKASKTKPKASAKSTAKKDKID